MAYARLNTNDLIKKMSNANTVVKNWDVLCSYDIQSLNKVLLEEYKKHPVYSRFKFTRTKKIAKFSYEVDCDIQLGNLELQFSTIKSGIYNVLIPMKSGSYCNETLQGNTTKTIIPSGYKILASGPIQSVKGKTVYSANEIVEFGDQTEANVILHFGSDMEKVSIFPENILEDSLEVFDNIRIEFAKKIKEVNYKIVQIRKETSKEGLILTPKSFMFTTMSDERNSENGVLNIWVQTNESGRPIGDPQPSFYPNSNVLPVPLGHSSSLIFSHQLIYHKYLKPALEKSYKVTFSDLTTYNAIRVDAIELVPINRSLQYFFKRFPGVESYTYDFNIDYNTSPFRIFTHDNNLCLVWKYETVLEYEESKVLESVGAGAGGGAGVGAAIGLATGGPIGALVGGTIGFFTGSAAGGIASSVSRVKQQFTVTLSIDKRIPFVITDNTKFSSKIKLLPQDLQVNTKLKSESGYSLSQLTRGALKPEDIRSYIVPQLQKAIIMPDIDFGTLDYFAEANILFNEGRFKISSNKAVHFPYDTVIIGDIHMPQTSKSRSKRQQNNILEYPEGITSTAASMTSPINFIINLITNSFRQINPFYGINKIFSLPQTTNNRTFNANHFDITSSLLLGDLAIRSFTKQKPYYITENPINYPLIKATTLNIVTEYERLLKKYDLLKDVPEFDPILLMSTLEKKIINGNLNVVLDILYKPVALNKKVNIKKEIRDLLMKQEMISYDLHQENLDFMVTKNRFYTC